MPERPLRPYWLTTDSPATALLYHGDCLEVLPRLPEESVDLVFADPPFNIGYDYGGAYNDSMLADDYLAWTREWVLNCCRVLKPTGSFFVAIGLEYQAEVKLMLRAADLHWRDTIAWYYTFGPQQKGNLTPSWVAIHYFSKDPKHWTWNGDDIRVPSARQLKYGDKRADERGKIPDNSWVLLPEEIPDGNLWLESRVCGTFKNRTSHPCQMPEPVLDRIIQMSSNPGDVVLDPFLGSGTTVVSAVRLNRKGIGAEKHLPYLVDIAIPRLKNALMGRSVTRHIVP